jgi:hypothetical protein
MMTIVALFVELSLIMLGESAVVQIGGLFTPFDLNGNFSSSGYQQMAAFLMAIREINDKTDGIWDNLNLTLQYAIASPYASGEYGHAM